MNKRSGTPSQLLLRHQICHSLYSAANALVRAYRPLLEELDLTYPQYLVMLCLWEQDGVSIRRISDATRFDAPTLTPILKRLEGKGLILRQHSVEDERQKIIVLTRAGHELMKAAAGVPGAMACLAGMQANEARQLKELSERLYARLAGGETDGA